MSTAVAISGSPSPRSKSRRLLSLAVDRLARDGIRSQVVELANLPRTTCSAGRERCRPTGPLVVDHALRPLLASVGALVAATGVYGVDAQFTPDGVDAALSARVDRAVAEAQELLSHVTR